VSPLRVAALQGGGNLPGSPQHVPYARREIVVNHEVEKPLIRSVTHVRTTTRRQLARIGLSTATDSRRQETPRRHSITDDRRYEILVP
jgi:hypothetical protein